MSSLAVWEAFVEEHPAVARISGPPNWLVLERKRNGEEHMAAALRVRAEYGLDNKRTEELTDMNKRTSGPSGVTAASRLRELAADGRLTPGAETATSQPHPGGVGSNPTSARRGRPKKWASDAERKRAARA